MTSKQRSYLMKLASTMEPIMHIGKGGVTPEVTASAEEALEARELIKISVLKNNFDDLNETAQTLAERTRAEVVKVIGRKIIIYRPSKTRAEKDRILLPEVK